MTRYERVIVDQLGKTARLVDTDETVARIDLDRGVASTPPIPQIGQPSRLNRRRERRHGVGDEICAVAKVYGVRANHTEFATSLRRRELPKSRYLGYIAGCYPLIVGFNRGLIQSFAKVDHVRESTFLGRLARQLEEEQAHNQLWRRMLAAFGIDDGALYQALEQYMANFSPTDLDRMTERMAATLASNLENVAPGIFPDPVFPEPVLALYHHMWMTGRYDHITFWEHFAGQYGMEAMIFDFVSTSFYPGIIGNLELDDGPRTTNWWKEHARQGAEPGKRSSEEMHLEFGKIALNRSRLPSDVWPQVRRRAEDTMRLFTATMIFHDRNKGSFSIDPYRSCKY